MVAALVKGSEEEENWILAEVVSFNPTTNKYEVDDIDEEQKDRHTLSRRRVVPLPLMRANPETDSNALFMKEAMGKNQSFFLLLFTISRIKVYWKQLSSLCYNMYYFQGSISGRNPII